MTQEQINSLLAKPATKSCTWTRNFRHVPEDADGNWHTGCQEIHVFISGTPHENDYMFCPYCGGKIEEEGMKEQTTDERVASVALILGGLAMLALLPVWAPVAVVWMLATRRSLRGCNRDANRMSGLEA